MEDTEKIEATVTDEVDTSVSDEDLAAFDEVWDDDSELDDDDEIDLSDDDSKPTDSEPEVAKETPEDSTETQESTEDSQTEDEPHEDKPTEGRQLYKLKGIDGNEKEYSIEDVLNLAGKGLDYDGVRRDRDELREYKAFLKELADNSGLSVDELVDSTRARIYKDEKRRNGEEVSDVDALRAVQRNRAQKKAAEAEPKKVDTDKMIKSFVNEFKDVQAKDIPESVWKEAHETGDLAGAYRKYSNNQKDAEIARLKEENNKLKQNQKNKDRSIGSQRSAGNPTPKDPFDEGWDSV